ncbi:MAG: hypothetical protein KDJ24_08550 [Gammaproteobacteria bacterium]|nr:hypothetical protein [Gammaproteobacteria bacterium]
MADHEIKQSDLLYDYIKFHIGLYLVTPASVALIGQALNIESCNAYRYGLGAMILIYLVAGTSASIFVANHLFAKWGDLDRWRDLGVRGEDWRRKFLHHYLYWIGLMVAIVGGVVSVVTGE